MVPEADRIREKWINEKAARMVEITSMPHDEALRRAERSLGGWLDPNLPLDFDDGSVATPDEVLKDLKRYLGKTLADPIEGRAYGKGKAKILRRPFGEVLIHSFAHGGATYRLISEAASAGAGFEPMAHPLALSRWLSRDLPEPDWLLGQWLTTTSRALLYAPTGLGKSMFAIALAMAMAAGLDFLHWKAVRPVRVLYVDGEMATRDLVKRFRAEAERLGFASDNFHALSHEDIENFQPLNTKPGQDLIDAKLREIGKVDLIIFDNIMCLIAGLMVDEDAWSQTMPWIRKLTNRGIGQLWVHHTGNDERHPYGTNTRLWQMDTVLQMARDKQAGADVSFKLTFKKARNHNPQNRHDFEDVTVALAMNTWTCQSPKGQNLSKVSPLARKFHEALRTAAAANPESEKAPFPWATLDAWREECVRAALIEGSKGKTSKSRTKFWKYKQELIEADCIKVTETTAHVIV